MEGAPLSLQTADGAGGELRLDGAQGFLHRNRHGVVAAGRVDVGARYPEINAGLETRARLRFVVQADLGLFDPMGAGQRTQSALDQGGYRTGAADLAMIDDEVHALTLAAFSHFD